MLSFVIPSLARPTLARSLQSLIRQTQTEWRAHVIFDGVQKQPPPLWDSRITYSWIQRKIGFGNSAGYLRNIGLSLVRTPWVAFLDDDDSLDSHYIEWLLEYICHQPEIDLFCFRMVYYYREGVTIPDMKYKQLDGLRNGQVGISFALRTQILTDPPYIRYKPSWIEDWLFLREIINRGYRTKLLDEVAYNVRF
jgi:glycosyltransferase involved in cell wall biosynthesis